MEMPRGRKLLLPIFLLAAAIAAVVMISSSYFGGPYVLEVKNAGGEVLSSWKMKADESFVLSFCHSVNKGMVREEYGLLPEGGFYLKTAWFQSYGAGMMDCLSQGVTMKEEGDFYRLDFPVEKLEQVSYAAAGIADHVLEIHEEKIHLFQKWPYQQVIFSVRKK